MSSHRFYNRLRHLFFRWLTPLFKRWYALYTSKKTYYSYKNVDITVFPGVFHPRFTISTKYFIDYLLRVDLADKKLLELGCGSGLISLHAAKKGARVMASDINPSAIEGLEFNASALGLSVESIQSDLFQQISCSDFDFIIINPPYYPKNPSDMEQAAWYCGEDFDYFSQLFEQLPQYTTLATEVLMVLSEDCDLSTIKKIAKKESLVFELRSEKVIKGEINYIFSIERG